jgi:WD40 repeat protein
MAPVLSLCFSPNGLSLASGDATGSVILWEVTTGAQLAQFCVPPPASADVLAFAGGEILAAGGTGSDIHLWDLSALLRRKSI